MERTVENQFFQFSNSVRLTTYHSVGYISGSLFMGGMIKKQTNRRKRFIWGKFTRCYRQLRIFQAELLQKKYAIRGIIM